MKLAAWLGRHSPCGYVDGQGAHHLQVREEHPPLGAVIGGDLYPALALASALLGEVDVVGCPVHCKTHWVDQVCGDHLGKEGGGVEKGLLFIGLLGDGES